MTAKIPSIAAIDLFCGVGGLTHGLVRKGIKVKAGIDNDERCRFAYEANNPGVFIHRDVQNLDGSELASLFGRSTYRLLAGCAPCQSFSTYSRMTRGAQREDLWPLLTEFGRLVSETRPELVTMENVPQIVHHPVFGKFIQMLDGYHVAYQVVECAQYGVPQTRKRLVLLASRLGPIKILKPQTLPPTISVRNAIAALPVLAAGDGDRNDPLHTACRLSELNLKRIRASKPGGTWRDWDQTLLAACHKRKTGATFPSVYGRMSWDEPAPTITTQCFGYGNGRFGHPEQDRAITLREAATLQTFPIGYRFLKTDERLSYQVHGRLIGNAVPVRIGEVIAESFLAHIRTVVVSCSPKAVRKSEPARKSN
jgi:DNA (cytosine-5)-methyltransferase 1